MSPADRAQLAMLLEVASTPTPGAVDRRHDHADLRFAHFLAGAVGARAGVRAAAEGAPVGPAFETAVEGMAAAQSAGNTQFGALLLLVPLVRAAGEGDLTPAAATRVVERSTVADAAAFCRAFDAVDVGLDDPPEPLSGVDVREPTGAAAAVERRELTLAALMAESAGIDGIAREWVTGFERTFGAADRVLEREGELTDRAAQVYLELLAETPDTWIVKRHDDATAERVSERAQAVLDGEHSVEAFADGLLAEGVNPGTTADLLVGALYVALERGVTV